MRRFVVPLLLAAIVLPVPALAQADGVGRGPVPDWVVPSVPMAVPEDAGGLIFVRRQDVLVRLDAKGLDQHLGYHFRILHPNALQAGNLSIAWNPAHGAATVHMVRVHRDGQVIDVLKTTKFEVLRREDQLEAMMLNGVLTAVLKVADLRVGDELEVAFTTRISDPTLAGRDAGLLMLGPNPAPGRFRLGLSWDAGQKPTLRLTPDLTAAAQVSDTGVELKFDNPALLTPPKDAPLRYQWQRIVEYSDFADWQSISRHFAPLYAKAATLADGSPLAREADRIAAAHADPMERARAALKLVQQDVRYIYVGLDSGNLTPATAEETWQRRYGDCKGKTAMLLALLARLGIAAEAVLANNSGGDDGLDTRLPSPRSFDHVLVRARIGDASYWMDGTLPAAALPAATPVLPYRWILPLSAQGSSIEAQPWSPARQPDEIQLVDIDARPGFDAPARVTTTSIVRGIKGLQQQVQMSGLAPDQLTQIFRQEIVGDTWQSVDKVQWRYDSTEAASILTISGTWAPDWDDRGDGERARALPGGGFNPPERRVRATEQDQQVPFYKEPSFDCHVTTVRVPQGARAGNWTTQAGFDVRMFGSNYYRAFDVRDDSIRMVRGFRVEQPEIDADTARKDNQRIARFDNSMAWITYTPGTPKPAPKASIKVPATDEVDWVKDSSACLAPATKR